MTSPDGSLSNGYDAADQLTAVDYSFQADESYAYDENGNRVGGQYLTGAGNRLLRDAAGYSYQYDNEGNRLYRFRDNPSNPNGVFDQGDTDATAYTYDYRNRLTDVLFSTGYQGTVTGGVRYGYDHADRQVVRKRDFGGDLVFDEYRYQVQQGSDAFFEVHDPDGLAGGAHPPSVSRRYLYSPAVDQILAEEEIPVPGQAGVNRWGLPDHEGTIRDVVRLADPVNHVWEWNWRQYDSFGKLTLATDGFADFAFGLGGMPLDTATYLYQTDTVYYDPLAARRLSEDWAGFASGTTNFTIWAGNDPWNYIDPSGMCGQSVLGALGNSLSTAVSSYMQPYASAARSVLAQPAVSALDWGLGVASGVSSAFASTSSHASMPLAPTWTPPGASSAATSSPGAWLEYAVSVREPQEYVPPPRYSAYSGKQIHPGDTVLTGCIGCHALAQIGTDVLNPAQMRAYNQHFESSFKSIAIPAAAATAAVVTMGSAAPLIGAYNEFGYWAGATYSSLPPAATSPLTWGGVATLGVGGYTYYETGNARSSFESGLQAGAIPLLMMPQRASADLVGAYTQLRNPSNLPQTLGGLQTRIDTYAQRAQQYAWDKGLSGTKAGNVADRYFTRAVNQLGSRLEQAGSQYGAYAQYGRTPSGREVFGQDRPAGSLFLDAALTNQNRSIIYSGWDTRFQATPYPVWNTGATNAGYINRFQIQEGVVREISVEARRP